jgi:hypothetical protein
MKAEQGLKKSGVEAAPRHTAAPKEPLPRAPATGDREDGDA